MYSVHCLFILAYNGRFSIKNTNMLSLGVVYISLYTYIYSNYAWIKSVWYTQTTIIILGLGHRKSLRPSGSEIPMHPPEFSIKTGPGQKKNTVCPGNYCLSVYSPTHFPANSEDESHSGLPSQPCCCYT